MNDLIRDLCMEKGCSKEQAEQIFRLIRNSGYSYSMAFEEVMGHKDSGIKRFKTEQFKKT